MKRTLAIASDHAGYPMKLSMIKYLKDLGYRVRDFGTDSDVAVDYPDYVHPLAETIESKNVEHGILICGSAQGVSITANKHAGIRATVCWNTEIAALARQHNNANVVCLPARFLEEKEAYEIVKVFLKTGFEGGRHQRRIDKISI